MQCGAEMARQQAGNEAGEMRRSPILEGGLGHDKDAGSFSKSKRKQLEAFKTANDII